MRLATPDEIAPDDLKVVDAICLGLQRECFEDPHLDCIDGDDELTATCMRHVMRLAKRVQTLTSIDAQSGLQGIRWIVDACMNDAAVMGAGFQSRSRVTLNHADRTAALRNCNGRREPGYTTTDDNDIDTFHLCRAQSGTLEFER